MAGVRALPDLKTRLVVDTSGLKTAKAEAEAFAGSGVSGFGKVEHASKTMGKEISAGEGALKGVKDATGGFASSLIGLPPQAAIAAGAVFGIVVAGKALLDTYNKSQAAQRELQNAYKDAGVDLGKYQGGIDSWLDKNKAFIKDQDEAKEGFAALTREGLSQKQVMDDMGLSLDLAATKQIPLKDAVNLVAQAEMGRGKGLVALGINMKDYPVLAESQTQANKKIEAAQKAVEQAQLAQTAAVKAHGPHSAQAVAATQKLADANAKLAEAHNYAAERAKASADIHDALHKKLDGGRGTIDNMTQAQDKMGAAWKKLAEKVGPPLQKMMDRLYEVFADVLTVVSDAIGPLGDILGALWNITGPIRWILEQDFTALINAWRYLWGVFNGVRDAVKSIVDWLGKINLNNVPVLGGIIHAITGRAAGGVMVPNKAYLVGEHGPEIFTPSTGGSMTSNEAMRSSGVGGHGGKTIIVQPVLIPSLSPIVQRQVALDIREQLRRLDKQYA